MNDMDCDSGFVCLPDPNMVFQCTVPCTPFDQVADCPAGSHCFVDDTVQLTGHCLVETVMGSAAGDACAPAFNACAEDTLCVDQGAGGMCLAVCRLNVGDADCPAGTSCVDLGAPGVGACL